MGRLNGQVDAYLGEAHDADSIACHAHNERIEAVDFHDDVFVTTTLNEVAIWRREVELEIPYLEAMKRLSGGNKCLRISPGGDRIATGKYSERPKTALRMIDIET